VLVPHLLHDALPGDDRAGLAKEQGQQVELLRGQVELTPKEYDLLALLFRNAGSVVTRERIMEAVWDEHWFGSTKTLDVHVSWLRKKLEDDPGSPRYITTIRGVGFRFTSPEELDG